MVEHEPRPLLFCIQISIQKIHFSISKTAVFTLISAVFGLFSRESKVKTAENALFSRESKAKTAENTLFSRESKVKTAEIALFSRESKVKTAENTPFSRNKKLKTGIFDWDPVVFALI
ncbi:MAG TPA: hypothetical protein VJL58_02010 [Pyrinomonadaceae bacterium]|nr:hypothetical protein [Pyrinomonadaceae bacterium]